LIAGILLGFILLLSTDNDFYETWCSRCNHLELSDIIWVAVLYIDRNLLLASGLGMILAWLSARFWIRDIRADKTTVFVAGIILGLILGVADDQIDTVISACKRFPDLVGVDVSSTTIRNSGLQHLKEALPDVKFIESYRSSGSFNKTEILPDLDQSCP
jgi:hypothetical protein